MPVTKFLIGTRIGATAAIVPLTVNAIPLLTRLFENSLLDTGNGILEAALAMGATPLQLVTKFILPEPLGSVIKFLGENPGLAPGMKPRNIFLNL